MRLIRKVLAIPLGLDQGIGGPRGDRIQVLTAAKRVIGMATDESSARWLVARALSPRFQSLRSPSTASPVCGALPHKHAGWPGRPRHPLRSVDGPNLVQDRASPSTKLEAAGRPLSGEITGLVRDGTAADALESPPTHVHASRGRDISPGIGDEDG
jgi:hypothetical protein